MQNAGKALLRSNSCVLRQGLSGDVRLLHSVTRDFAFSYIRIYTMQFCTSVANERDYKIQCIRYKKFLFIITENNELSSTSFV